MIMVISEAITLKQLQFESITSIIEIGELSVKYEFISQICQTYYKLKVYI